MRLILAIIFFLSYSFQSLAQVAFIDHTSEVANSHKVFTIATESNNYLNIYSKLDQLTPSHQNIILVNYDECGVAQQTFTYHFNKFPKFQFQDYIIDQDKNIILLVSLISNPRHVLICKFKQNGRLINHLILSSQNENIIPYKVLSNHQDEILLFSNNETGSSITVLSDDLEIKSLNSLIETEIWGTFLSLDNGNYFFKNGHKIYLTDHNFNIIWVKNINATCSFNGLLEYENSIILSKYPYSRNETENVIIALDKNSGDLLWQSRNMKGIRSTILKILPSGNLGQLGGCVVNGLESIHFAEVDPQNGDIIAQHAYNPINKSCTGVDFSVLSDHSIIILAKTNFMSDLIQMKLIPTSKASCGNLPYNEEIESDPIIISNSEFVPFNYIYLASKTDVEIKESTLDMKRICSEMFLDSIYRSVDTTLCGENSLFVDFGTEDQVAIEWSDGSTSTSRDLQAGHYTAKLTSCNLDTIVEFHIRSEDCRCPLYVPNSFSPNGDKINDEFKIYSPCPLESVELEIFNRYGTKIYSAHKLSISWDGKNLDGASYLPGVYIVKLKYDVIENNSLKSYSLIQDLHLIR